MEGALSLPNLTFSPCIGKVMDETDVANFPTKLEYTALDLTIADGKGRRSFTSRTKEPV